MVVVPAVMPLAVGDVRADVWERAKTLVMDAGTRARERVKIPVQGLAGIQAGNSWFKEHYSKHNFVVIKTIRDMAKPYMHRIHTRKKGEKHPFIIVRTFILLLFISWASGVAGQEKYEVVSTSRLNVRNKPTAKSPIIGRLNPHEQIDVYSIANTWAKIIYKNRTAYVSSKYIRKMEVKEETPMAEEIKELNDTVTGEPEKIGNAGKTETIYNEPARNNDGKIGIDFVPSVYGGFVNFVSDDASPKGNIGFGVDFAFQFVADRPIGFIPNGYYAEASLGYSLKGSCAFPMHYITIKLSPFGYRYEVSDFTLFGKIGAYTGYTFSTIETYSHSFDSNIDFGVLCEIGVEYKKIGVGLSYERGLTNVCSSNLKLNSQCVFLNLSYRLFNLK